MWPETVDQQPDFDMVINRHLTRAHRLRAIQQVIAEDPGIVHDLLDILSDPNPATAPTPATPTEADARRRTDARTQAEKVTAFFRGRGNTMATVRQIAEGTGLTRNTVNALLYNSGQKDLFVSLKVGPKRKLWRLREGKDDEDGEMSLEQLAELGLSESDLSGDDSEGAEESR